MDLLQNSLRKMKSEILSKISELGIFVKIIDNKNIPIKDISMIKYAREYDLCYLDGPAYNLIKDKKDIFLICPIDFKEINNSISYIKVEDPKLLFYKLSYLFNPINGEIKLDQEATSIYPGTYIDKNVEIGENVRISPGVCIYPNTKIGNNVTIESGTVIGCTGLLWTWDGDEKVMLSTTGGVIIEDNCHLSANVSIVRGACSEYTQIKKGTFIAPGTAIGHGVVIGERVHIANNCTIGGSATIKADSFLGCAATISPSAVVEENCIVSSACCVTVSQILKKDGIYIGTPAKYLKRNEKSFKIKGVPYKRK